MPSVATRTAVAGSSARRAATRWWRAARRSASTSRRTCSTQSSSTSSSSAVSPPSSSRAAAAAALGEGVLAGRQPSRCLGHPLLRLDQVDGPRAAERRRRRAGPRRDRHRACAAPGSPASRRWRPGRRVARPATGRRRCGRWRPVFRGTRPAARGACAPCGCRARAPSARRHRRPPRAWTTVGAGRRRRAGSRDEYPPRGGVAERLSRRAARGGAPAGAPGRRSARRARARAGARCCAGP